MLVLSRKAGEEIVVNGCIRLRIVGIRGNRVKIGIDAPRGVAVLRAEIAGPDTPGSVSAPAPALEPLSCC
jgi:carbon storage regulator